MKSHHIFSLIILVFVIISACTKNNDAETIPSEAFLPKAERNYDYNEDTLSTNPIEHSKIKIQLAQEFPSIILDINTGENKEIFIPNRMYYLEKEDFFFDIDNETHHFISWKFEDSIKTINAFYNWLDCFGNNCITIKLNEKKKMSRQPFIIWVTNQKIIYLSAHKNLKIDDWQALFIDHKNEIINYTVKQNLYGEAEWNYDL